MTITKYPRTPHLEGSGLQPDDDPTIVRDRDLAARAGCVWLVEEKVDGANAGLFFDGAGTLHLQSRGHRLDVDGRPFRERHFNDFKTFARMHEAALLERLEDRYTVYGEWLGAVHTQFYDALPSLFLEFDVLDRVTGEFLSTPARDRLLVGLPLPAVPVLHRGAFVGQRGREGMIGPSLYRSDGWRENLEAMVARSDAKLDLVLSQIETGAVCEGLYVKAEDAQTTLARYKHVRQGFVQTLLASDSHWHSRPIVRNACAPGVAFLDPAGVAPRVDRVVGAR
ncbi:MAG: RNA ligase family protein [Pseudomonadota bacterium]